MTDTNAAALTEKRPRHSASARAAWADPAKRARRLEGLRRAGELRRTRAARPAKPPALRLDGLSAIAFERKLLKVTQGTVAEEAGLAQARVSEAERGAARPGVAERIESALGRLRTRLGAAS